MVELLANLSLKTPLEIHTHSAVKIVEKPNVKIPNLINGESKNIATQKHSYHIDFRTKIPAEWVAGSAQCVAGLVGLGIFSDFWRGATRPRQKLKKML